MDSFLFSIIRLSMGGSECLQCLIPLIYRFPNTTRLPGRWTDGVKGGFLWLWVTFFPRWHAGTVAGWIEEITTLARAPQTREQWLTDPSTRAHTPLTERDLRSWGLGAPRPHRLPWSGWRGWRAIRNVYFLPEVYHYVFFFPSESHHTSNLFSFCMPSFLRFSSMFAFSFGDYLQDFLHEKFLRCSLISACLRKLLPT